MVWYGKRGRDDGVRVREGGRRCFNMEFLSWVVFFFDLLAVFTYFPPPPSFG